MGKHTLQIVIVDHEQIPHNNPIIQSDHGLSGIN